MAFVAKVSNIVTNSKHEDSSALVISDEEPKYTPLPITRTKTKRVIRLGKKRWEPKWLLDCSCYICGKKGYTAKFCPKPKTPKSELNKSTMVQVAVDSSNDNDGNNIGKDFLFLVEINFTLKSMRFNK